MNFIDKFLLWLFLLPTPFYEKLGVNMPQLKAILLAKLTMDNRRPSGLSQMKQRSGEKKEISKATLSTFFGSFMMGFFFLFSFLLGADETTQLTFFFSMFIVMLCMTLITDFTSVLIDVRDNFIILPKPINDVTFLMARLIHISIRIFIIVIPLTLPSTVAVWVKYGANTPAPFLLMVFLSTLLSIFIINAIYILILKITTPARFQSFISYIQIAFAILIYASYQILPRLGQSASIMHLKLSEVKFMWLFAPYWFGQSTADLASFQFSENHLAVLLSAFLVPVLAIWLVVRYFAPAFNQKLSMITASSAEQPVQGDKSLKKKHRKGSVDWLHLLASKLTQSKTEYMGFIFTSKMMGRSRDFKLKVYPAIGYVVVMGVMFSYNKLISDKITDLSDKSLMNILILFSYFSCFIMIAALSNLSYSEKFRAGWIFDVTPIDLPGKIISGAVKSVMVTFYVPVALITLAAGVSLLGLKAVPNIVLACYNVISICTIMAYIMLRRLPFSRSQQGVSKGKTFMQSLLVLMIPGIFGTIHWLISGYWWMVLLCIAITALVPWLVFDEIKKLSWAKMK